MWEMNQSVNGFSQAHGGWRVPFSPRSLELGSASLWKQTFSGDQSIHPAVDTVQPRRKGGQREGKSCRAMELPSTSSNLMSIKSLFPVSSRFFNWYVSPCRGRAGCQNEGGELVPSEVLSLPQRHLPSQDRPSHLNPEPLLWWRQRPLQPQPRWELTKEKNNVVNVRFSCLFWKGGGGSCCPAPLLLLTSRLWAISLHLSVSRLIHRLHLFVTLCCGFPPGSETDRNSLSMLSHELSPAQSPGSKVRKLFLIGQPLSSSAWLPPFDELKVVSNVTFMKTFHSDAIFLFWATVWTHKLTEQQSVIDRGHGGNCFFAPQAFYLAAQTIIVPVLPLS